MSKRAGCKARQVSDQMSCGQCGLLWDINDPEPPTCKTFATGKANTPLEKKVHPRVLATRSGLTPTPTGLAAIEEMKRNFSKG